jgi:hypothetical protein
MAASLEQIYRYPFASYLEDMKSGLSLRLATFGGTVEENPYFFEGTLIEPQVTAQMLQVLANIVSTRFYIPIPTTALDPVVTCNPSLLRFEGFSACCGVYCRVDLLADSFDSEINGRGTTNVDFNLKMRAALATICRQSEVKLSVGANEVILEKLGSEKVIEKKVKLPIRWIKGFSEVQSYLPTLTPKFHIKAAEVRRFIRGLPKGSAPKKPSYVVGQGKGLRLSKRDARDSVRLTGVERLRSLEPLLNSPSIELDVWSDNDSGVSAWQITDGPRRIVVAISPEIWRGFSGEGQVLNKLSEDDSSDAISRVRAQLDWQPQVDLNTVAKATNVAPDKVCSALAVLGSRGLVGYDQNTNTYFHRELPFDLEKVEQLQPRLRAARKLIAEDGVEVITKSKVMVQGTVVKHRVNLEKDTCTCPWYGKHQNSRGPCKHILAARMKVEND